MVFSMSLEDVLNSPVALPFPIPAKFANGRPIILQHVSAVANFLLTTGASAKAAHPALWEKAEGCLLAANENPEDRKKGQAAWQSVYNLLSDAKLLE